MEYFVALFVSLLLINTTFCSDEYEKETNGTDENKDMYVIHAMVYEIGILTNKSDDEVSNVTGNHEAVTFYKNNGSDIDFSNIPETLLTNVTAQRMVGVAPVNPGSQAEAAPWKTLNDKSSLQQTPPIPTENVQTRMTRRATDMKDSYDSNRNDETSGPNKNESVNRVNIEKGTAMIPEDTGVKSIVIPPLLAFKNNFSNIPVPIPNTSIVHYAKINTVVKLTED